MSWRQEWLDAGPNRWRADMTLGEAMQVRQYPWACACIGPPASSPAGTPCRCALTVGQTQALHRGAHIVATLLDTVWRRRLREAEGSDMSWQQEWLAALAEMWPCKVCALPQHVHDELPNWVRPHDYERAPQPRAVATIEVVGPAPEVDDPS